MYDLEKIYEDVRCDIDRIGIKPGYIRSVHTKDGVHSFLARCKKYTEAYNASSISDAYEIEVCSWVLESLELTEIRDIMAHEILHTCDGAFSHGPEWKRLASILNKQLGYDIQRTKKTSAFPEKKYKVVCQNCGYVIQRNRRSKVVKHPELFLCPACSKNTLQYIGNS